MSDRIAGLVAKFNGAIKYTPMLQDHPDWTDEECLAFAKLWHPKAIAGLRDALARDRKRSGPGHWHNPPEGEKAWNEGVPYCRNLPTTTMIDEAKR